MSGYWRVSNVSTAAAKAEKLDVVPTQGAASQGVPRLLGYSVSQYTGTTAAGVTVILEEGPGPTTVTVSASAVVGVMGAGIEFAPVSAFSSAGLAQAPYISLKVSASVATSTQVVTMWGDYR